MSPDYASWAGQYVLADAPISIDGWDTHRVAGRHLAAHPSLPVVPVTVGSTDAGALLGWPVSPDGELVTALDLDAGADIVAAAYAHGGRWLLVTPEAEKQGWLERTGWVAAGARTSEATSRRSSGRAGPSCWRSPSTSRSAGGGSCGRRSRRYGVPASCSARSGASCYPAEAPASSKA